MLGLGAPEQLAHRDADRRHHAARRRAAGPTGRAAAAAGRRGTAGASFGRVRGAARERVGQLVGRRPARARAAARTSRRASRRRCAPASWMPPRPARRRPAPSAARRMMPDAQMSLNTPRSSRRRYMRRASPSSSSNSARCSSGTCVADAGDRGSSDVGVARRRCRRRRRGSRAGASRAARARSARRCRSRRAAGSRRGRGSRSAPGRLRRRARAARRGPAGIAVGLEELRRAVVVGLERGDHPLELGRRAGRHRRGAAHHREERRPAGRAVQPSRCARRSPIGIIADAREAHVLVDHLARGGRGSARGTRRGRRRRARRGRRPAARDGSRSTVGFDCLVPLPQLLAPRLVVQRLLGAGEPRRESPRRGPAAGSCTRSRSGTAPPSARAATRRSATCRPYRDERLRMRVGPVPRDGPGEVHRIAFPRPRAGWLEAEIGRRRRRHGVLPLGRVRLAHGALTGV